MIQRTSPLLLPLAALLLAAIAQYLLISRFGPYGWLVYLAAIAVLILSKLRVPSGKLAADRLDEVPRTPRAPISKRARILGFSCGLAAVMALALFSADEFAGAAWLLHLLSLVLYIAMFISERNFGSLPSIDSIDSKLLLRRLFPFVAVLGLAIFARWWQLDRFPFGTWTDEGNFGLQAAQILRDPAYRPVFAHDTRLPAHFLYLFAAAFRLFGVSTLAMRIVAATISLATVMLAYFVFTRWFGRPLGIFAAALLSVMRYDLTFSRFGHHGITTPFFVMLSLYLLDRALERKGAADFAWLGLALGLGMAFYPPTLLLPPAILAFLAVLWMMAAIRQGAALAFRRYISGLRFRWLALLIGLLLAVAPLLQFALRNPGEFTSRANTVSIFEKRDEPNLGLALWNNTQKHLQMFNVRGDVNGRHNLPNAPMLDPVMGVLFVLGLGLALWNWRRPLNLLVLLLFGTMLLGGILSLDFEAPQSLRSIGVIPALLYFMVLTVAALLGAVQRALVPTGRSRRSGSGNRTEVMVNILSSAVLIGVVAVVADLNFVAFFVKQQNDRGAWAAYSTAETIVAHELSLNAAQNDFLVSALYDQNPTTLFLAQGVSNVRRWTVTDRLPIAPASADRGLILMVDRLLGSAYHDAVRVYPDAAVTEHRPPTGGDTLVYEVMISAAQLKAAHGVSLAVSPVEILGAAPRLEKVAADLSLDWSGAQPLPVPFIAELRTTLDVPEFGEYRFHVSGTLPATLSIDGFPVSEDPTPLAGGLHDLLLMVEGGPGTLTVLWQPPGSPEFAALPPDVLYLPTMTNAGLLGEYFASPDWTGEPKLAQLDPQLEYYFHVTPLPRPYSIQWSGAIFAPEAGTYMFSLYSIDASTLWLDGQMVVVNPDGGGTTDGHVTLVRGWHQILVRFADKTGGTRIYLYWQPPGAAQGEIVPARVLRPPMAEYPPEP